MAVLDHSNWRVGSEMTWMGRLDRLDQSGGPDDESDEIIMMKYTRLDHSAWRAGSKMA